MFQEDYFSIHPVWALCYYPNIIMLLLSLNIKCWFTLLYKQTTKIEAIVSFSLDLFQKLIFFCYHNVLGEAEECVFKTVRRKYL